MTDSPDAVLRRLAQTPALLEDAVRGRLTLSEWAGRLANHDDNHLDQIRRAVDGRP